jgi:hypothetical protein
VVSSAFPSRSRIGAGSGSRSTPISAETISDDQRSRIGKVSPPGNPISFRVSPARGAGRTALASLGTSPDDIADSSGIHLPMDTTGPTPTCSAPSSSYR